ncbi:hypothetical protein G7046_g9844 [Stylonectria norvegica]|nr:hypothetical protein G7046_g9844 [Stylonectria norvegica]
MHGASCVPVIHEQGSHIGQTWYFCPAHRVYHAIHLSSYSGQPFCGECAVLYYYKHPAARWMRKNDLRAGMSDAHQVYQDAADDMEALLREINEYRDADPDTPRNVSDLLAPPPNPSENVLDEIPKEDRTYRSISSYLIPHPRFSDMYLLEYRTFAGALAYQPCAKNMDLRGYFKALRSIDHNGDHLFKVARVWSCILQAMHELPKEVRWVLATIYNFANEMLRPEVDEDELWRMRAWLLHWYGVADSLFSYFNIPASAPSPDWFHRPTVVTLGEAPNDDLMAIWDRIHLSSSESASNSGSVIRHLKTSTRALSPLRSEDTRASSSFTSIHLWLAEQHDLMDLDEDFDPTPRGRVSARTRLSMSPSQTSEVSSSGLNPHARVFLPTVDAGVPAKNGRPERTEDGSKADYSEDLFSSRSESGVSVTSQSEQSECFRDEDVSNRVFLQ